MTKTELARKWDAYLFFGGKMPRLTEGVHQVPYPVGYIQIPVQQVSEEVPIEVKVIYPLDMTTHDDGEW